MPTGHIGCRAYLPEEGKRVLQLRENEFPLREKHELRSEVKGEGDESVIPLGGGRRILAPSA